MNSQKPIPCAVIGHGHIGKRHARILKEHPLADLRCICDPNDPGLEGIAHVKNTVDLFNQHPELQLVHVCTPNGLHYKHSKLGFQHRCHVVCEKPLTLQAKHARELEKMARKQQRKLFCVVQNRYSPIIQYLKNLIDTNALGNIAIVQVECHWNRDERYYQIEGSPHSWRGSLSLDGGPLYTQFSHFIDILLWLFPKTKTQASQYSICRRPHLTEFEDTGSFQFAISENGLGTFTYTTAVYDKNYTSSITLIGDKGTIRVGGQYMNQLDYVHIQDHTPPESFPNPEENNYGGFQGSANNHGILIDNVLNTIAGTEKQDIDPLDGVHLVEVIEHLYQNREKEVLTSVNRP